MENIFKVQKTADIVLPCGVAAQIRGLEGKHQAMITVQDQSKRMQGLKRILWDCLVKLGDSNSISEDYIDKLTSFDRKCLLWKIRELSNKDTDRFVFDYEFPTDNNRKLKQRFEVEFNSESFPVKPAKWVREKMIIDLMEEGYSNITEDSPEYKNKVHSGEFPVMFDTYEQMLQEKLVKPLKLPECGVEVFWHLSLGKDEDRFSNIKGLETSSHTQLQMHTPKYRNVELSKKGKDVIQAVPLDDLSNIDIEELRHDIMDYEGNIDSMIVVQSDEDTNKIAQIDLLQTPAFFFASLAL